MMQLECVLAFSQAPVDRECYTKIQKFIEVQSDTEWVIKINRNIYRQRQEGRVWNKLLLGKLISSEVWFRKSNID